MEHREQDADEHDDRNRDRDIDHQLLDERHGSERGIDTATEDQRLQDLRDEVDDDNREDRREVDTAESREDASERREDRVDDHSKPADDGMPGTEPDPGHRDARDDEQGQRPLDEPDDVVEEQLAH